MLSRRLAAIVSLVLLVASVVLAVVVGVQRFPRGLSVLACVVVALVAAWWALVHRGAARVVGAAAAGVLLVGAVVLVVLEGGVLADALILAGLAGLGRGGEQGVRRAREAPGRVAAEAAGVVL